MLKELLVVGGLVAFAAAFRACRHNWARKLGAIIFLGASFLAFFFCTHCLWAGLLGVGIWFLLPWIELLTRVRRLRLPKENRLIYQNPPEEDFFPNASSALAAMSEAHYEHVADSAWNWVGMEQFFRLHWNPEERAVAAVCLCEQENVAFVFISITSRGEEGQVYRTTNFPFSPTLKSPPEYFWNHVPCEKNCFHQIRKDHQEFLKKLGVEVDELALPDPEELEGELESEMNYQIEHNLEHGIIKPAEESHFRYSKRGLFFLWKQFAKDMIRLC